jgi:hypothetical protein
LPAIIDPRAAAAIAIAGSFCDLSSRCKALETRRDEYVGIDHNPVYGILRAASNLCGKTRGSHGRGDSLRHSQRLVVQEPIDRSRRYSRKSRPWDPAMSIDSPPTDGAALPIINERRVRDGHHCA